MAKFGVIPSSFIAAHPTHRLDARFWLRILETIKEMELDPATITRTDLRRVFRRHDDTIEATETMVRYLRDQAQVILEQARVVDRTLPDEPRRALAKRLKEKPQ